MKVATNKFYLVNKGILRVFVSIFLVMCGLPFLEVCLQTLKYKHYNLANRLTVNFVRLFEKHSFKFQLRVIFTREAGVYILLFSKWF